MTKYTFNEIRSIEESGSAWWYEFILKHFVLRLVYFFANFTKFTPNQITILGFIFDIASAFSFLQGTWFYLIIGAFLFEFGYICDCIDGRLARLKGESTKVGGFLDHITSDTWGRFLPALCLIYGQYLIYGCAVWIIIGMLFIFLSSAISFTFPFKQEIIKLSKSDSTEKIVKNSINTYNKILEKYFIWCKQHKVGILPFSRTEYEMLALFIGPLLNLVKEGFIAAIFLESIVYCVIVVLYMKQFHKIDENARKLKN